VNIPSITHRLAGILLPAVFLVLWCAPAHACLNFLHEWIPFASATETLPEGGGHGLGEACAQFRKDIAGRLASDAIRPDSITLAAVTWGDPAAPASASQTSRVLNALEQTWPASSVYALSDGLVPDDDGSALASATLVASTPLILTVHVASCIGDRISLLDFIFFDIAIIRTILREKVTATFRVIDRSGRIVYLNRFAVSPTIVFDVMFRPTISLLSYFEKHDSRPWILDYGEIFKDVASEAFKIRPESGRMPNFESSIVMPPPATATSTPR